MGYTHYWRMSDNISREAWAKIKADAEHLISASPVGLAFEYDDPETPHQIDDEEIRFNANTDGASCETFWLHRKRVEFSFCKTRGRPYDTPVCAILAVAAQHAHEAITVSSDGGEQDWKEPLGWASYVLGRNVPLPLTKSPEVQRRTL